MYAHTDRKDQRLPRGRHTARGGKDRDGALDGLEMLVHYTHQFHLGQSPLESSGSGLGAFCRLPSEREGGEWWREGREGGREGGTEEGREGGAEGGRERGREGGRGGGREREEGRGRERERGRERGREGERLLVEAPLRLT